MACLLGAILFVGQAAGQSSTPNAAPVITNPGDKTYDQGETITAFGITVTDADQDTVSVTVTGLPSGLSYTNDQVQGTVAADATPQAYSVTVSADDGVNAAVTETFTIAVTEPAPATANALPVITAPGDKSYEQGEAITAFGITVTDADSDPLSVTVTGLPSGLSYTSDQVSGTVADDATAQDYTVTISADDGVNTAVTETFTITVTEPAPATANAPPAITDPGDKTYEQGEAITSFGITVTDADSDPLSVTLTGLPSGLSYTSDQVQGTVAADATAQDYTVTVSADDGVNAAVTETFTITVTEPAPATANAPPAITAPSDKTYEQGEQITAFGITVTDADSDPLSVTLTGLPSGLSYTSDQVQGTVAADATAQDYTVTISADDGVNSAVTETFTITVTEPAPAPSNAPPVITNPGDKTYEQGETITSFGITVTDADSDTLTVEVSGLPSGLSYTSDQVQGAVAADAAAQDYTVTISADDGVNAAVTETFTITVTEPAPAPANAPPVITDPGDKTYEQGETITAFGITVADADADPVTVTVTGLPSGLSYTSDQVQGTVAADATAQDYTVTISADDAVNAAVTETFTITVTEPAPAPANAPPAITSPGDKTFEQGETITSFGITVTDADQNPVTVTVTGLPSGLSYTSDQVQGTVAADATAQDYTVTISADDGVNTAVESTFTITVTEPAPANAAPVITNPGDKTYELGETITSFGITVTDADQDPVTVTVTGLPSGLSYTSDQVQGTVAADAAAQDYTVTISADDAVNAAVTETFTITVTEPAPAPANAPPVITNPGDKTYELGETITAFGITATDAAAQDYTVTITAEDGVNAAVTATFMVTVTPPVPTMVALAITLPENKIYWQGETITAFGITATTPNGDPVTVTVTGLPSGLSYTNNEVQGTVAADAAAQDYTVTISAGDGVNAAVTATFTITVIAKPLPQRSNQGAPTVAISGPTTVQTGSFQVSITFSEAVTGFEKADVTVGNGRIIAWAGSGSVATMYIKPAESGTVTVDVAANVAVDNDGNGNTAATRFSVEANLDSPTVTISGPTTVQTGSFSVSISFSESMTGFEQADVTVGNGRIWAWAYSASSALLYVAPAGSGTVTVDVAANVATDADGNGNLAATQFSVEADVDEPGVTISGPSAKQAGPFNVTIAFSESVTGFEQAEVTVGNGAVTAFSGSGASYTATITPSATGTVTVDVAAGAAVGIHRYGNLAARQFSVEADLDPPTVTISGPSATQTGPFDVTIAFSESVTGFESADVTVGNGAVTAFSGWRASYTATITPTTASGTVTVDVAAGAAQDQVDHDNTAASRYSVQAALVSPTVIISGPSGKQAGPFAVTITFSESVTGFEQGDVTVGNGAVTAFSGSGASYTATITPSASGTVTVNVAAGAAVDSDGDGNLAASRYSVAIDLNAPTVTISGPTGVQTGTFIVTITFSESVTGFESADVTVRNGRVFGINNSASTATPASLVWIEPAATGTVTVDVPANVAVGANGKGNAAASRFSVEADLDAPTVTISGSTEVQPTSFQVSITFSKSVTGFERGDVAVGNGAVTAFSGSGATYTATITPSATGTVTVDVAAEAAVDTDGNGNLAATQFSVEADLDPPTVIISGPSATQAGPFTVSIAFSRAVTGLEQSDVAVGNGAVTALSGSGASYTATITPTISGTVTVDVAAGAAQDQGGRDNTAASRYSVQANLVSPTVIISGPSATQTGAFIVTITFSESVTEFDRRDVTVGNGAVSAFSGSGVSYTVGIKPTTASGTVTVDVAAGAAVDSNNDGNTAATQFSVEADPVAPTVTISGPTGVQPTSFQVSITFSEAVTGFEQSDVTVGNGKIIAWAGSGSAAAMYIDPAATGTVTVDVAANVAVDDAGNGNTAATRFSVEADLDAPTVTISGPTTVQTGSFQVSITFSEAVTGFEQSDVTVGNGRIWAWAGSGPTAVLYVAPAGRGTVTVDVAANVAVDDDGNGNLAATRFSVEADVGEPGVTISGPTEIQTGAFTVDIDFSESVTGFEQADVTVGNGRVTGWAETGGSALAIITPAASGTVTVDVAAGVAVDADGYGNAAATQFSVEADIDPPTVTIQGPTGTQSGPFDVTIAFSEVVTGFEQADVTVGNGVMTAFSGSGASYTATITPKASGTVTVDVAAEVAKDHVDRDNTAASRYSVQANLVSPLVIISGPSATQTGPFDVTITFSESVTGFEQADVTVGNGAVTAFSGSGASYTATITPKASGTVTVDVAAGVATDSGNDGNTAAGRYSVEADFSVPTYIFGATLEVDGVAWVMILFPTQMTGFEQADVTVGNGTIISFTYDGSGPKYPKYFINIRPTATGTVTVDVPAGVAVSAEGYPNAAAPTFSVPVRVDQDRPTAQIIGPTVEQSGPFDVTITFSEAVAGFEKGDLLGYKGTVTAFSGSGASYTATITPTTTGLVNLTVPENVATDLSGRFSNTASNTFRVSASLVRPTTRITGPASARGGPFDVRITFSESVTGFEQADVTVGNGAVTAFSGSRANYRATITPAATGTVTVDVPAGVATDSGGDGNTATSRFSVVADLVDATVSVGHADRPLRGENYLL